MAWPTQNRNTKTVLLNQSNYYMYTKVGHEQGSAFFSTDWVRSHDQITRQQPDFCPHQFFIHHYLPPHNRTQIRQPQRDGRAEKDGKRPRAGVLGTPTVFYIFFSITHYYPPPQHVPSPTDAFPTPSTRPQPPPTRYRAGVQGTLAIFLVFLILLT